MTETKNPFTFTGVSRSIRERAIEAFTHAGEIQKAAEAKQAEENRVEYIDLFRKAVGFDGSSLGRDLKKAVGDDLQDGGFVEPEENLFIRYSRETGKPQLFLTYNEKEKGEWLDFDSAERLGELLYERDTANPDDYVEFYSHDAGSVLVHKDAVANFKKRNPEYD